VTPSARTEHSHLLSLAEAAPLLGCRDPRTARRRLAELGVPVVTFAGRRYVRPADIHRAIAASAHAERLDGLASSRLASRPGGVRLPPGVRLGSPEAEQHLAGLRPRSYGRAPSNEGGGA
jgi:hypothetical protein